MSVAGVQDDRDAAIERMIEDRREARVPALGHPRRLLHGVALLGVIVNVEVRRLENAELEPIVLNFVAPEVLRAGRERGQQQSGERGDGHALHHGHSCAPAVSEEAPPIPLREAKGAEHFVVMRKPAGPRNILQLAVKYDRLIAAVSSFQGARSSAG
jgi:hypothetical protein